jgi:hypothetical protein
MIRDPWNVGVRSYAPSPALSKTAWTAAQSVGDPDRLENVLVLVLER